MIIRRLRLNRGISDPSTIDLPLGLTVTLLGSISNGVSVRLPIANSLGGPRFDIVPVI